MKYTVETYLCDGCGQRCGNEKEMQLCEENHKGKVLCLFVLGNEKIDLLHGLKNKENVFHRKIWLPSNHPDYRLPFFLGNKEVLLNFQYQGEKEHTSLKQEEIPVYRLVDIE
jgi:hypothetical protein